LFGENELVRQRAATVHDEVAGDNGWRCYHVSPTVLMMSAEAVRVVAAAAQMPNALANTNPAAT
jgi:hypothetical protein